MKKNTIIILDATHAQVTKAFEKQARIFGTPEYREWRAYRQDFPSAQMVTKTIKKNASKRTYKNLTYANMERFRSRPCPFAAAGIYEDGHLVSGAYLGSHDLICGVATEEGYRRRGYASEVVSCLLSCIFSRSMDAVALWCSDPDAARMYEGIGFRKRAGYIFLRK